MTPEEREELLAGYALGTLSRPDIEAAETLVRTDSAAAAELHALHEIVDMIALDVPLRRADPALRARVLAAARAHARTIVFPRMPITQLLVGTAAAVAIIVVGMWATALRGQIAALHEETATLSALVRADAKRLDAALPPGAAGDPNEMASQQDSLAVERDQAQREAIVAVTLDPAAKSGAFDQTNASHGARGRFVWSGALRSGVLVLEALPTLPLGDVYQVWLDDGTVPVSGGTFVPSRRGEATVLIRPDVANQPVRISIAAARAGGASTLQPPVVLSAVLAR